MALGAIAYHDLLRLASRQSSTYVAILQATDISSGHSVGVVAMVSLEYDLSPVGPYRQYVTMGSLVSKSGALGQWGSRLCGIAAPSASDSFCFCEAGSCFDHICICNRSGRPSADNAVAGFLSALSLPKRCARECGVSQLRWLPSVLAHLMLALNSCRVLTRAHNGRVSVLVRPGRVCMREHWCGQVQLVVAEQIRRMHHPGSLARLQFWFSRAWYLFSS